MASKKPSVSDEERQQAMLTHFAGVIFPAVAAYIGWVMLRDRSEFLAAQTRAALNWGITMLVIWATAGAAGLLSFGILGFLPGLAWVLNAGFCIIAGLRVRDQKDFEFPFSLDLIK